jgi:hypothetical protein
MEGRSEGMGRIMAESFGYMGEALILASRQGSSEDCRRKAIRS